MANYFRLALALGLYVLQFASAQTYTEQYRPQFHFTPAKNWMNDPNGLVYHNGVYHMYYQYNPGRTTWGAMSWGHATSNDLTHWKQQPIALLARGFPGDISESFFSGSVVVDEQNTSGFVANGKAPFVAIYTSAYSGDQRLPSGKTVVDGQQAQSIAYSLDEGMTWRTYDASNPVIHNPPASYQDQIKEFRDPFVFWHDATRKWIMVLVAAQLHKLLIYTSSNLKDWTYASEFGPVNAVGSNIKWIAQISLNPGGPPGTTGSGTQYVVGRFDGRTFVEDIQQGRGDIVIFQDFKAGGTFDNLGWSALGGLSGASPAQGALNGQQAINGYQGRRLVNTFLNGDATTGTLTSPSFIISHKYINFLIGDGNFPNQECINLVIGGQTVLSATGANEEMLRPITWDVSAFVGQVAAFQIVDSLTGDWGHINIDQISFGGPSTVFQDFEDGGTFANLGWIATGDLIGASPAQGSLNGQQAVSGNRGRFVNTFLNGDVTTGTLSKTFKIAHRSISFLVGGGNFPGQECINLVVQGKIVRTATGANSEQLNLQTWDVSGFVGQDAIIQIVDQLTGSWGHILIDQITFSDASRGTDGIKWMDWGPDFYAAIPYNGLAMNDRINLGWMNNWKYGQAIPTSSWRSAMSVPRLLSLKTINGQYLVAQQPQEDWASLETGGAYSGSWGVFPEGNQVVQLSGKTLDITLSFSDRVGQATSPQFGLLLRANSDLSQQTRVGYDFGTRQMFIDRTRSGNVGFDDTFANTYYAPLAPASDGTVTLRILLDWSSVEFFGGKGESTLTTQIFPGDGGTGVRVFSTGGDTRGVTMKAKAVGSSWN